MRTMSVAFCAMLLAPAPVCAEGVDVYANPSTFTERPLQPGDPAPVLAVDTWVRGEPVPRFAPGTAYVVEFWATWCLPCRKSIPELSALQRARQKDGLRVIGVAAAEEGDSGLAGVEEFVARVPMEYSVAYAAGESTFNTWMRGARNSGLPWVFVVDRTGKLAWWGQPFYEEFPKVVDAVLDGTWSAAANGEKRREGSAREREGWALEAKVQAALAAKDDAAALPLLDRLIALDPQRYWWQAVQKLGILLRTDRAEALAFARDAVAGLSRLNPHALSAIAEALAADGKADALPIAEAAVLRARELTGGENGDVFVSQSEIELARGRRAEAIALLEAAITKLAGEPRAEAEKRLRELRGTAPAAAPR